MKRLGFSYEALSGRNPRIIYASISGFGQKGPYSAKPAYDMIAQGVGGTVSITGNRAGRRFGWASPPATSAPACSRQPPFWRSSREGKKRKGPVDRRGHGGLQVAFCENTCARYFATGEIPKPSEPASLFTPFQVFPTKDGYMVLIAVSEEDWQKFCKLTGRNDLLSDPAFRATRRGFKTTRCMNLS